MASVGLVIYALPYSPLLLHIERSELRGFEHLIRMPLESLMSEMFWTHREEALGPPLSFFLLIYFKDCIISQAGRYRTIGAKQAQIREQRKPHRNCSINSIRCTSFHTMPSSGF